MSFRQNWFIWEENASFLGEKCDFWVGSTRLLATNWYFGVEMRDFRARSGIAGVEMRDFQAKSSNFWGESA